jgi:hypothetical protein
LLASGWWFSPGTPVFSIDKTDSHGIAKILLKKSKSLWEQENKGSKQNC